MRLVWVVRRKGCGMGQGASVSGLGCTTCLLGQLGHEGFRPKGSLEKRIYFLFYSASIQTISIQIQMISKQNQKLKD
jgi:hypothetical protein